MTQLLREQAVDRAWLEGVEEFGEETAGAEWEEDDFQNVVD